MSEVISGSQLLENEVQLLSLTSDNICVTLVDPPPTNIDLNFAQVVTSTNEMLR